MAWTDPATRSTGYKVTAANWNELVNNMLYLAEIGYTEFTAQVASTATTVGTANQVVSLGAITYQNAPVLIEFFSPRVTPGAATSNFGILRDGTTVIGTLAHFSSTSTPTPVYIARRLTPTAASHTYNIAWWNSAAGTTNINGGTGGTAGDSTTYLPGWIRARYIPT